jgi:hypothetical protein
MENNKPGFQNNQNKLDYLLDSWYKKTYGENYLDSVSYNAFQTKINLASNDVVTALEDATEEDYLNLVSKKAMDPISSVVFTIPPSRESLDFIFYSSTNYFDMANPQKALTTSELETSIRDQFDRCNPNGSVKIIIGGNNIGEEWQFKNYKDSKIIENRGQFHGLIERKNRLIEDIKTYLRIADEMGYKDAEIYLIKGYQEHVINKKLCVDVFQDVVNELGSNRVHYISEGVSPYIRCVKQNKDGTIVNNEIKLLSNMRNKGKTAKSEEMSVERYNGESKGTTTFVLNGNVFGKLNDKNEYHVTGQAEYLRTTKGNKPDKSAKGYDVFSAYLSKGEIIVVEGSGKLFYRDADLQLEKYHEKTRTKKLIDAVLDKIEKKLLSKGNSRR